ncbi:response regulator transcription factor [Enterococcus faecalis]|uniref:response regulator transcription factor n=1 Tax=Enterococcus faecalis TaxID=1351 RepID=UPI002DB7CBCC|nr:response regulator transcription factor [Enterococcus faecalis]MEB6070048.1 response regulator transcription factor [Enterococcus faecalis]MEB6189297.1 response regulator transcription factor [Enterococcus faecalis]
MKILLAEDEKHLSMLISKGLKKNSYAVDQVYDGKETIELLEINTYDLLILDLNLPKMDGFTILKKIRQSDSNLKILILSARVELEDKISGLDFGANDYLTKPFEFEELIARIRNLLRWSFYQKERYLSCDDLLLDIIGKVVSVGDFQIKLTNKEYAILEYLMFHVGEVLSSEKIIEHVWDSEVDLFSNSFKFHIHSLKKKLSINGNSYIENIRGMGYVIRKENPKNG